MSVIYSRIAIVTGATSGIGEAVVRRFAAAQERFLTTFFNKKAIFYKSFLHFRLRRFSWMVPLPNRLPFDEMEQKKIGKVPGSL
ncbi:MAG TPA: hypothetical protein PLU95_06880 [Syntrophales bacterium]|nr:hypothetical protein [Syntrophales bacterium]HQK78608.1 hypothetical protein [Syntrophales bacterium]